MLAPDKARSAGGPKTLRALALMLLVTSSTGFADDTIGGSATTDPDPQALEEVVVVGQKQEISLQKAPLSLTALSSSALQQANVVAPIDLNGQVPGLVFTTSEGYNNSIAIRGMGLETPQSDSTQPSVSYHENGIYIASPVAANTKFLDVDHVEVLRGPQGTVFGQNSIAGTVNVITTQPTFDSMTGYADFSYGSFNLIHPQAAINIPISDRWAIRAAADLNLQDGYVTATQVPGTNGDYKLENQDNWHVRLTSLFQPVDPLSISLQAEYATAHEHGMEGKSVTAPGFPLQIADPDPNPWHESSDFPETFDYKQGVLSATIAYQLSFATLKSLSSLQFVDQCCAVNKDGLDVALAEPFHTVQWFYHKNQTFTQELDITSNPGEQFSWVAGVFFLHNILKFAYDTYAATVGDDYTPDLLFVDANAYFAANPAVAKDVMSDLYFQSQGFETRKSYSSFGQGVYRLLDTLRLTAGLRYTYDYNTTNFSDYFGEASLYAHAALSRVTWRTALDYDLSADSLLFASVSTGVKPGGGNISQSYYIVDHPQSGFTFLPALNYAPEAITAYEIGSKNKLFDNRLSLNVSGFFYQDRNYQFEAEDIYAFQGGVATIPDVHIYGLESEVSALLPGHLRFDGNVSWEKGKIASHFLALDNVTANPIDNYYQGLGYNIFCPCIPNTIAANPFLAARFAAFKDIYGNSPPSLPELTAAVNLKHTLDFANGSKLLSSIGLQYRDHYATSVFGDSEIYTAPSYVLLNAYFDYKFPIGAWDTSLAVNNIADRAAVESRFTNEFGGQTTQRYYPPREFIGRIGYRF